MEDEKLPLTEHLTDLRKRITVSLIALSVTFGIAFTYSEEIFKALTFPLHYTLDFSVRNRYAYFIPQDKLNGIKLVFLAPAEAFWMNMKVAFVAGIILSLPVIFHQLWRFVSPGLLAKERKYVLPFIFSSTVLFLVGAGFCFLIVLPLAMSFLLTYKVGEIMMPMLSVGQYVDFCLKFILAFGAIFELPIIIVFLTRMGIVSPRTLAKNRKYAVLVAFVIAALLTPTPDAFNQLLMAIPIILLYEIGIWISPLFLKREEAKEEG
ncbi:MAG: twin-arginine translocase subunit TatC [Thermodesulfovibrionales bacterium]|jgi:sec-independent protein translocase protein TatC